MRLALLLIATAASGCAAIPAVTDAPVSPNSSSEPVSVPGVPAANAEASAVLNGTVTSREALGLPAGAVVTVRLQNLATGTTIGEQEIRPTIEAALPFAIAYSPRGVDPAGRYGVRAEIRDAAGALLWASATPAPIFTRGAPLDGVEVVVERARP